MILPALSWSTLSTHSLRMRPLFHCLIKLPYCFTDSSRHQSNGYLTISFKHRMIKWDFQILYKQIYHYWLWLVHLPEMINWCSCLLLKLVKVSISGNGEMNIAIVKLAHCKAVNLQTCHVHATSQVMRYPLFIFIGMLKGLRRRSSVIALITGSRITTDLALPLVPFGDFVQVAVFWTLC